MYKEWKHSYGGGRLFSGIVVMTVGLIFLLNNLGILRAQWIFRVWFWPLLLIGFGVVQLLRGRNS